ncbi:MAG: flippase activity-associated protein Agl23 [Thermoanaerobaculia bacterium]
MNDSTAASPSAARPPAAWLLLLSAIALAALLSRFWALGERPLHHDESIHAYQSWTLSRGGDWKYDPAYHGPFLYYANALVYKLFGATNATARVLPAAFGLILIGFAWPLRRWIGNTAALAYAVLVLTSAHFSYFSRFIREDLYSLVFTLGTILAFQRFLETDRSSWLLLSATFFALAGVTKENAYMTGVLFVGYGIWCVLRTATSPAGPKPAEALRLAASWVRAHLLPLLSAGVLFLVIWVAMYTAFGKHPGDWWAIDKAVRYWMGQHAIARIPGPWWYYFPQLAYYDTAILLAAAFAFRWSDWKSDPLLRAVLNFAVLLIFVAVLGHFVPALSLGQFHTVIATFLVALVLALFEKPRPQSTLSPFLQFVAYWAVGSLGIYAWAREKVPWLTVHPLLPLTIVAALGVARLWSQRRRPFAKVALAAVAALLVVNASGAYLASFRYGAHDLEKQPRHAEMLAYVQTSEDLVRALGAVDKARARVPAGQNLITVAGESAWPLTWYLRDVPTAWASRIEQASTPIIVADWDPEGALEKQLAPKYDARRVPIRAWWFPEPRTEGGRIRPGLRDFIRWWLFHEIWSPIGSQDATFYVRKDLGGSGVLEPIQLSVQDTSARDYPNEGIDLPAPRVFGSAGSEPGQLNEPRGVATDASGSLYVADSKNSRIDVFDGNGAFRRAIGSPGEGDGQLKEPCGVTVGPDGTVYVADTWNHRVARFSPDGQWLGHWKAADPGFFGPRSLVLSKGSLYVADTGNKRIVRFDADGKIAGAWGGAGADPGQFVEPVGVTADAAGRIFVADTGNHRIQVFDGDGKFVRQFPVYGWKDFYTEPYLAVGPAESVFATDAWKGRIAQYDVSGTLIRSFKADGLKSPTGIAVDAFGRVFVSDRGTGRVFSWALTEFLR